MPKRLSPHSTFVVGWLLINLIGGAAAGTLETRLEFLGTLLLAGTPPALLQGLYLRHHLPRAWLWALMLAVGWPLAHLLYVNSQAWLTTPLVSSLTARALLWEVFWLNVIRLSFVMLLVGVRRRYRLWLIWPAVSLVGGALLGGMGATVCRLGCAPLAATGGPLLVGATLGAVSWGAYALLTAPVLAHLTRAAVTKL
jgi:hypothetical protein